MSESTKSAKAGDGIVSAGGAPQASVAAAIGSMKLSVNFAFGCQTPKLDALQSFAAPENKDYPDRLLHKIGKQLCMYDPETKKKTFFPRPRSVVDILHFAISPNGKHLSLCELVRHEKGSGGGGVNAALSTEASIANAGSMAGGGSVVSAASAEREGQHHLGTQVAVYRLDGKQAYQRQRTCHHVVTRPFVCSSFCGDPRLLAALTDEPERQIVVWHWDKEKVFKSIAVPAAVGVSLLRGVPCNPLMLTTSGPAALRCWTVGADGALKNSNLLPSAKEALDVYTDHVWLPSALGLHRMVALADPDPLNDLNRLRRQCLYIFEGQELLAQNSNKGGVTAGGGGAANRPETASHSGGSASSALPFAVELRQTVHLKLDHGVRVEKIVSANKSFSVVGSCGIVITFERTDDKHEPYVEARRLSLGDLHLVGATVFPSEEKMVLLTRGNRMLSMAMDITPEQLKKYAQKLSEQERALGNNSTSAGNAAPGGKLESESLFDDHSLMSKHDDAASLNAASVYEAAGMSMVTDVTDGGYHCSAIVAADVALERPIVATIGADWSCRVWNYLTGRCELVHSFRQDEPLTVACHPAGFQLVISFKDRLRMFNVLNDKLKVCREAVLKNTKVLKFSNGGQYLAAASTINVMIYDTRSFQQLMNYQGHMMTITRLCWAPGDQVLFSAGLDGNVYGWPIAKEGRIDVITASNRSSQVLDIAVDSLSTVFPVASREEEDAQPAASSAGVLGAGAAAPTKGSSGSGSESVPYNSLGRSWLIVSSLDGHLRMPHWFVEQAKSHNNHSSASAALPPASQALVSALNKMYPTTDLAPVLYGDAAVAITCVCVATDRAKIFVGTSAGSIRVYPWPPEPGMCPAAPPSFAAPAMAASSSGSVHSLANTHSQSHGGIHPHTNNNSTASLAATHTTVANLFSHHHMCYEMHVHCGAVVALRLGSVDNSLISAGADGSVFVLNYEENAALLPKPPKISKEGASHSAATGSQALVAAVASSHALLSTADYALDGEENMVLNNEVVLLSTEDIEEHVNRIHDLQKLLVETQSKNDFVARKLEADHHETLKRVSEQHEFTLNREKDHFEKQRIKFDGRIRELLSTVESKENEHIKILTELENKYEHKLGDQLERYDLLSEKMTLLKQKCEALLEAEKTSFNKQMNDFKNDASNKEKKLRSENRRAIEDKAANENAFREIINQQEDEYEDELRQLIKAAEGELVSERETILKLRTLVQTKNTKLDQLKNKLLEVDATSKARLQLLTIERGEKQKLLDTIDHYKKNLIEREDALAEKEKVVLELRSKTRTLENFRFVLDHRLQQLSSERGPITNHIEGLEKHIATMYEELVEEFSLKKSAQESSSLKDQRIQWISQDLTKTRQAVREKEQYIAAFKRELNNLVASMVVGKELEESVKLLYKKFVRGEQGITKSFAKMNVRVADTVNELVYGKQTKGGTGAHHRQFDLDEQSFLSHDTPGPNAHRAGTGNPGNAQSNNAASGGLSHEVEEALIDTAQEADRQKKFVERQSNNLKHRLRMTEREAHLMSRHRLHENSDLLFECNDLRSENKALQRDMDVLKHELDMTQRTVSELRREIKDLHAGGPLPLHALPQSSPQDRERVSPGQAEWVVHNSLQASSRPLSSGPGLAPAAAPSRPSPTLPADADEDSVQSLHGVAALLRKREKDKGALSQSMPNLHAAPAPAAVELDSSPTRKRGLARGPVGLRDKLANPLAQSQPLLRAVGAVTAGSAISIPRADIASDAQSVSLSASLKAVKNKPTSSMAGVGVPASAAVLQNTVDRLSQEVGSLAQQLDDALREREMQRMELSRLRKQLMLVSQQAGSNGSIGPGAQTLPSLNASVSSVPQNVHFDSNVAAQQGLTHADIFGQPSEEDKQSLRLSGRSKPTTPGVVGKAVSSSKRDEQNQSVSKKLLSREGSKGRNELRDFSLHSFDSAEHA